MAGVRARRKQANYLDCSASGSTAAFEFMGTGFTEMNEEPGAQTNDKRYINSTATSKSITGYEWQTGFTADQIRSETAIEFICAIGELMKTGPDAERDYVAVDLDKPVSGEENTYHARKIKVAIEVSSFGDEDGEMTCEGNFLGVGDIVEGTFNTTTKAFALAAPVGP